MPGPLHCGGRLESIRTRDAAASSTFPHPATFPMTPLSASARMARYSCVALACAAVLLTGCKPSTPSANTPATNASEPAKTVNARLSLVNNNGDIRYDGSVDTLQHRQAITQALGGAFGPERVSGSMAIDGGTIAPDWLSGLPDLLPAFTASGAALTFEGRRIELGGSVSPADRARLLAAARQAFPGYTLGGLFEGADAAAPLDEAASGLAALEKQAKADAVVRALNRIDVDFEPGSARIAPASLDILSRAAQAINGAAPGTRIAIRGFSAPGDATADDPTLPRQRAEAVKVQLILNGVNPGQLDTVDVKADATATGGANRMSFEIAR